MEAPSKTKILELRTLIAKMPLQACYTIVLPEFGIRWSVLSRKVRSCHLPMEPGSIARVLANHAANTLTKEEVADLLAKLRLRSAAIRERQWHVITLMGPSEEELSVGELIANLPDRVANELMMSRAGRSNHPEVLTTMQGDLIYMSVQMVSATRQSPVLFLATPPGEPVALVSTLRSPLIAPCVLGLGYQSFEDAKLFGRDIPSLLRIHNRAWTAEANLLSGLPLYNPVPVITKTGIDFTYREYNKKYIEQILGPNPPLLTELKITKTKPFFDPSRLDKKIIMTIHIKTDHVAAMLKSLVDINALPPTSDFFHIFHKAKSNKFEYIDED